jgi:hypothetical protein
LIGLYQENRQDHVAAKGWAAKERGAILPQYFREAVASPQTCQWKRAFRPTDISSIGTAATNGFDLRAAQSSATGDLAKLSSSCTTAVIARKASS